jgi:hypothetical protein
MIAARAIADFKPVFHECERTIAVAKWTAAGRQKTIPLPKTNAPTNTQKRFLPAILAAGGGIIQCFQ